MTKGYTLELHPEYVELSLDFESHPYPEYLLERGRDLAAICAENGLRRVLARVNISLGNFTVSDVFEIGNFLAITIPGLRMALLVDAGDAGGLIDFFQLAGSNRGLTIDFFSEYDSAKRWLRMSERRSP